MKIELELLFDSIQSDIKAFKRYVINENEKIDAKDVDRFLDDILNNINNTVEEIK